MAIMEEAMGCGHEFEPIQGWTGRYRCKWCKALAYRRTVLPKGIREKRSSQIVVYTCSVCGADATYYNRKSKSSFCKEHS
jgi:RNase P subunit RPR2